MQIAVTHYVNSETLERFGKVLEQTLPSMSENWQNKLRVASSLDKYILYLSGLLGLDVNDINITWVFGDRKGIKDATSVKS